MLNGFDGLTEEEILHLLLQQPNMLEDLVLDDLNMFSHETDSLHRTNSPVGVHIRLYLLVHVVTNLGPMFLRLVGHHH